MSSDEHGHDHHAPTATAGHGHVHDHDAPVDDGLNPSATHGHDHAAVAAEGGREYGHASPAPKVKQKGHGHSHGHGHAHGVIDSSIVRSRAGLRAVLLSLAVLLLTTIAQLIVFVSTGSVALLADLIHNGGDASPRSHWASRSCCGHGSLRSGRATSWWPRSSSPPPSPRSRRSSA